LPQLKRTLAENYDIISWVIRILIGGAANIMLVNALIAYIPTTLVIIPATPTQQQTVITTAFPQIIAFLAIIAPSPIAISLALSKTRPKLRIVPPFYITLVSAIWLYISWFNTFDLATAFFTVYGGAGLAACGYVEDKLITSILGVAAERESIYYEQLTVFADINDVKNRLSIPEIKTSLSLRDRIDGDSEHGYTFKTRRNADFVNKITLTKSNVYPETTVMKIVYYEEGRYNLRVSLRFLEEAKKHQHTSKMFYVIVTPVLVLKS